MTNLAVLPETSTEAIVRCTHCGQQCEENIQWEGRSFCCEGCKTVYEILSENNLCDFYTLDKQAAISQASRVDVDFAWLDELAVRKKLLTFDSDSFATVEFHVAAIHCVSCIWLLENLQRINPGILHCEVNFPKKNLRIEFDPSRIRLSQVASLISSLGYAPEITLDQENGSKTKVDKTLVLKLAIAGFCFGNAMLFSFPEYLGIDKTNAELVRLFQWLNVALSVPVFFYSGIDYFKSAFRSFQHREINIDVPIALGLLALFARSSFDIITNTGPGYLDSFTGLVFFLLIGRWFQSKTYESLSFDRDFRSYFPLAINRLTDGQWKSTIIYELKLNDKIRIRNMEIIPADSTLESDHAFIDYSFVTGESRPAKVLCGESVYAGGRVIGTPVVFRVAKEVSQSYLTTLWNHAAFKKIVHGKYQKIIDTAARRFTWIVLAIAAATAVYWQVTQPNQMWLVLTSVLMVACPCALALATPFTFGSMLRVFGQRNLYLKNADVIERLAGIDAIVFDKTGTVTVGKTPEVFVSGDFSAEELKAIKALTGASAHPLSVLIARSITASERKSVIDFREFTGKGIQGCVDGQFYKIGSAEFTGASKQINPDTSVVFVSVNDVVKGYFTIRIQVRKNIREMLQRLNGKCTALLSGDNEADRLRMTELFPHNTQLLFNQDPHDKLHYIKSLQTSAKKVLMIGDGLNDAGALKQSDVGIAVSDDTAVFSPASDGILSGDKLQHLDKILSFARSSVPILKIGFAISFFYNAIALSFAVTGHLTPLVAAILMPISSISVVSFSSLAVRISASRHKF